MKISHICPSVGEQMGGSERYVWTLSKAQSKEHDVHIYTTTRYHNRVGSSKINEITIHKTYAPYTIWNINPLAFILPALTKSESDIFHIHSHLYIISNQAILAKLMKKHKALLHLHGGIGIPPYKVSMPKLVSKLFYDRTLGKFTIENCDMIASVSYSDLEAVVNEYSVSRNKLRYIPNVVDTEIFKPRESSENHEKTLLYIGDLEPWKGIGLLMKWIHNHKWKHDEFTLRFIGDGSYLPYLLDFQKNLVKNKTRISLDILGPRNHREIPSILNDSDALILPSYWEGMPTVILEAMASGVPVISTKVGDVPLIIQHHETGFLIDRSFSSFQESVKSVFDDSLLINNIKKKARKLVEREYCLPYVERITNQVYNEIII